jgi:hypothetical protein
MKRLAIAPLLFCIAACATPRAGSTQSTGLPGHGAIAIQVVPNPVVAHLVSGNTYEFPFDVVVRETAGRAVTVNRVSADVYALGGVQVASQNYDAAQIASLGYPTNLPGNGELRYHFSPRKTVSDERLFSGVSAQIRVDAYDDTNTPTSATVTVTVTK